MAELKKLRRVPLKEELVALVGDAVGALVLQQMIYWSERTRDIDQYLKEEATRAQKEPEDLTCGWIYKSSDELAEELMQVASSATIRRRLQGFVDTGWLDERRNPKHKWDRTLQYRVNILKIQKDLFSLGYALEGYPVQFDFTILQIADSMDQNAELIPQNAETIPQIAGTIPESTIRKYDAKSTTNSPAQAREDSSIEIQSVTLKEKSPLEDWAPALAAFCEMAGHDPARLPPRAADTWRARLREIGANCEAGPALVETAIRLRPFSDIAFKNDGTWRTPWTASDDIEYLILCYKSGKYGSKRQGILLAQGESAQAVHGRGVDSRRVEGNCRAAGSAGT